MAAIVSYPTILTAADWNKKKGLVAKIVAEPTKLGDALREAEKEYKAVPWALIFAAPAAALEAVNSQILKTQTEFKMRYGILKDELDNVKEHATKVKGEWDKNKLVPKDAKTHLENLIKAIAPFRAKMDAEIAAAIKIFADAHRQISAADPAQAAAAHKAAGSPVGATTKPGEYKSTFIKPGAKPAAKPGVASPT